MNTFDELHSAVMAIMPNASFDVDNEGQIVIYTDLRETDEFKLAPFAE